MRHKGLKLLTDLLLIIGGNTLLALGVVLFIIPNGLVTGGTTGMALFANKVFEIPISVFVMVFNILMFLTGYFLLGKKFAASTLLSTFYYPVILEILQRTIGGGKITEDMMLSTIFAGLLFGLAIGVVIKGGGSTGGMDIPPIVLNKYFSIPVSFSMYVFDFIILILQIWINRGDALLYGMIMIFIYTTVIDKVLVLGTGKVQIKIVSDKPEEISEMISKEFDRGFTFLRSKTGYIRRDCNMILSVISNRQLPLITDRIQEIDKDSFVIISKVAEVRGRGFSEEKIHL